MAVLGIRKTTWNGLPVRDREIMRAIGFQLDLGVPADWIQPPNTGWYLFCDTRFTLAELAYFGCIAANLKDIPKSYELPATRAEIREDAKNFCENIASTPVVWPVEIPEDTVNRWQYVLDAQGTPSAMQMADHPPANWYPVEVEL